ncbi:MAG: hypothetical protein HOO95_10000 [Gallionella sp.]|nr:hypothetical protein [Gallionella sp.]
MEIIFFIGLVALIAFNVYASRRCYTDVFSSTKQRWFQIGFVWLVPFMGAALALKMLSREQEKSSGRYSEETKLGGDFAGSGKLNSKGYISASGENADSIGASDASSDA